jgi:acyl carrier protein
MKYASKIKSVIQLVINNLELEISDNTLLVETGILDSLTIISLINSLEDEFNIEIDEEELTLENFKSILSIDAMIERTLK